jgi:apolipoprotein N-acyltransferase
MVYRVVEEAQSVRPFVHRWYGRLTLVLLSVVLLTLGLAPIKQFYLAWVGLVPWMWVVEKAKSNGRAFLWSWLGGTLFFLANLWWLLYVSTPGMFALVIFLGLYWGVAAIIFRGSGWLANGRTEESGLRTERKMRSSPQSSVLSPQPYVWSVLGIATVWTALEWVRGTLFTGLPWLYLGHTQSPILLVCQIADALGVYGITFGVAATNALVYLHLTRDRQGLWPATGVVAGLWIFAAGYGLFRLEQMDSACTVGPTVLLVQSNYPQQNTGDKGASEEELIKFHVRTTEAALGEIERVASRTGGVDLVCWSETQLPALNEEFRSNWRGEPLRKHDKTVLYPDYGAFLDGVVQDVSALAGRHQTNVLAGGLYAAAWKENLGFTDRRNTAYLFRRDGSMAAEHSDKIHLVPFGEYIPFKGSRWFGWLHDFFMSFSPYDFDYTLTPGPEDSPTVLSIESPKFRKPVRLVVPICFEDIDGPLVAKMFRGQGGKRADVIVNLTNDGWFKANENTQHLQAAVFRSIENRAPTVRSVNTGISAIVDSYGRELQRVPVRTEGTIVGPVRVDSRYTIYTRVGDLFAILCAGVTGIVVMRGMVRYRKARRAARIARLSS